MKNKNELSGCHAKSRVLKTATVISPKSASSESAPAAHLPHQYKPMGKVWIAYEEDREGNPVILVMSPITTPVSVRFRHIDVQQEKVEKSCLTNPSSLPSNIFLKDGYKDCRLLDAMKAVHACLLESENRGLVKFDAGGRTPKTKRFTADHLMVCLFFYIYTERLYRSGDFFNGLRGKFYAYCIENLKDVGVTFSSKRYFYRLINELVSTKGGFDAYILAERKKPIPHLKGEQYLPFWYEVYRTALPFFRAAITKCG